jgi:hypothetical protein
VRERERERMQTKGALWKSLSKVKKKPNLAAFTGLTEGR